MKPCHSPSESVGCAAWIKSAARAASLASGITRLTRKMPMIAKPIISGVVAAGNFVFLKGVTADPVGDVTEQTRQVLRRIDGLLALAGTDKSKLLSAQVWLSDMSVFRQHNLAWNEWVDPANPPVRACVEARLFAPGLLVEIMVVATR